MNHVSISIFSAIGMMVVALVAIVCWRRQTRLHFKWFWVGGALWIIAVALKLGLALLTNKAVFAVMREHLPHSLYVIGGGLWVGVQSSLCEIGLTLVAVRIWRQLGSDAPRAIGIGVGAGAFEALILGLGSLAAAAVCLAGLPGGEKVSDAINKTATVTPLFWLIPPIERVIAILCHAPARALVLLGSAHRRPMMIFWGFLIFVLVDGIVGAFHLTGQIGRISMWWIELAVLPFALVGIPILKWCIQRWPKVDEDILPSDTQVTASVHNAS